MEAERRTETPEVILGSTSKPLLDRFSFRMEIHAELVVLLKFWLRRDSMCAAFMHLMGC